MFGKADGNPNASNLLTDFDNQPIINKKSIQLANMTSGKKKTI
jgi:hypothetical protein